MAGGALETPFDGHSGHGRASNGDGDAPVAAVDNLIKHQGTKHHDIVAKPNHGSARTETHRNALTTTKRDRG